MDLIGLHVGRDEEKVALLHWPASGLEHLRENLLRSGDADHRRPVLKWVVEEYRWQLLPQVINGLLRLLLSKQFIVRRQRSLDSIRNQQIILDLISFPSFDGQPVGNHFALGKLPIIAIQQQ